MTTAQLLTNVALFQTPQGGSGPSQGPQSAMDWLFWVLDSPAFKWVILILLLVMPLASLLTWAERRQSAMMQDRLGPNRAKPFNKNWLQLWGVPHFIADAIKMISKEDFVPEKAHKGLFSLAPIIALAPVFVAFSIIPFGPTIHVGDYTIDLQVFEIPYGILFYFAILTLANYGATLAGWSSYNKWALLGGLRASSQMMSYEVSMGLSLMGIFLITGTLEPGAMVDWQTANPLHWGFVVQPVAFFIFFIAAIAETKRGPFDLPEGEPEIIGYFVEYSGLRWGMFFLAEFIEIVFIAAILTTVFFGGYNFPFLEADGFRIGDAFLALPHALVVIIQVLTFGAKVVGFCFLQLSIRWTLPRMRPDQLMHVGWKMLLPLSLLNLFFTAGIVLAGHRFGCW